MKYSLQIIIQKHDFIYKKYTVKTTPNIHFLLTESSTSATSSSSL